LTDGHPEARVLLGQALLAASRLDEARVEMLAFTREHPEDAQGHRLLGEAQLRDGQIDAARASLMRSLEIDPGDEITRDLLSEADVDVAPISATVERWFATNEPPTTQTTLPEYAIKPEEQNNSLRALLQNAKARPLSPQETRSEPQPERRPEAKPDSKLEIELDPSYEAELSSVELNTSDEIELPPESARFSPKVENPFLPAPASADATSRNPVMTQASIIEGTATARHKIVGGLDADATSRQDLVSAEFPLAPPPELRAPGQRAGLKQTMLGVSPPTMSATTQVAKPLPAGKPIPVVSRPLTIPKPTSAPASTPPGSAKPPPPPARPPTGAFATQTAQGAPSPSMKPPAPPPGAFASSAGGVSAPYPSRPPTPRAPSVPPPSVRPPTGAFAHAAPTPSPSRPPSMRPPTGAFAHAAPPPAAPSVRPNPFGAPSPAAPPTFGTAIPSAGYTPQPFPAFTPARHSMPPVATPAAFASTVVGKHPEDPNDERKSLPAKAPPPAFGGVGAPMQTGSGRFTGGGAVFGAPAPLPITSPATVAAPQRRPNPSAAKSPWAEKSVTARPKRMLQLGIGIAIGMTLMIALVLIMRHLMASAAREEAIATAMDTGTADALLEATNRTADDDEPGMRALILSLASIEQGEDRDALAQSLAEPSPSAEARIARSFVAISRGEAENALTLLEAGLMGNPVTLAEAFHARALALDALGRHNEAQMQAREAATQRPGSPRHTCLVAREALFAEDPTMATTVLGGVNLPDIHACVHMVRGLVALSRGDLALADQSAAASLALPGTASDRGWAHYIRGRAAFLRNDETTARAELIQAAEAAPRADETLLLRTLRALLQARDVDNAQRLSARLAPTAPSPARRLEVTVEIALERRDFAAAEAALSSLPPTTRTSLVRARVLESQGRNDEALTHYASVINDPAVGADAALRQGRLLGRMGRMAESRAALETSARLSPGDAEIGAALARVALSQGDPRTARTVLDTAIRQHPEDARLQAVMAVLRATEGEGEGALSRARAAAQQAPTDPEIQLDVAQIARRIGNREAETAACAEAYRLDPLRFTSVLCLVRTASEAADFTRAGELLDQAAQRGAPAPDVNRARADLLVLQSRGAAGAAQVRRFLQTQRNDLALLSALARLQLQAEDTDEADSTARRVLERDEGHPEALYVRAYVANVNGAYARAIEYLDRISREGAARGITRQLSARVTALRAMVAFEESRYGDPGALVDQALHADPHCGTAHLLRALRTTERDAKRAELEAAVAGTETPAEAFGTLALIEGREGNGCALARQYLENAPSGYDHRDVEDLRSECR
jgi:tetratricopeptide (TPR) repeat protein